MKTTSRLQRHLACALTIVVALSGLQPGWVDAQLTDRGGEQDTEAPFIEFEQVRTGILGETQIFSATVTDNIKTEKVLLFYRFSKDDEYEELAMQSTDGSSHYSASVNTENVSADSIEYYISAEDATGNGVFRGYIFNPLVRILDTPTSESTDENSVVAAQPVVDAPSDVGKKSNKLYYILGAVAVVALVGLAASSGGSSGSGESCVPEGCQVNLVIPAP